MGKSKRRKRRQLEGSTSHSNSSVNSSEESSASSPRDLKELSDSSECIPKISDPGGYKDKFYVYRKSG